MLYEWNYDLRQDIVERIKKCFEVSTSERARILVVRLDVRYPNAFPHNGTNALISELLRRINIYYSKRKMYCQYVWAREQNRSDAPHVHLLLLIDGSFKENGWGVRNVAGKVWCTLLGGNFDSCIHLCPPALGSSAIMIRRPVKGSQGERLQKETAEFLAARDAAFQGACYLAKNYTKGDAPYRVREWGSSRF